MKTNQRVQFADRSRCPLCNSGDHTVFIDFREIPILKCSGCGFMFSSRLMAGSALEEYYAEGFASERQEQGQRVNGQTNYAVLSRLLDLNGISNLLDVGTGYGFLLSEVARHTKVKTTGVELSREESTYGTNELGLDIKNCLLKDAGLAKESFDLVTSFEVLEHIPEPAPFVEELASFVKPGGSCLIMTDNFESGVVQSMGPGFPKWIPHSHVSHFAPETLENLVRSSGLNVMGRFSYTPWELLASNALRGIRGRRSTAADSFDLYTTLETEMEGQYRLFQLRKAMNKRWAMFAGKNTLDGALMFVLAQKS